MSDDYKIFFWRYDRPSKGYRGFHLTADEKGCQVLLNSLRKKIEASSGRSAKFTLTKPTDRVLSVPNYRFQAKSWNRMEVSIDQNSRPDSLNVKIEGETAYVTISPNMAENLEKGIQDIQRGDGDWAISDETSKHDDQAIWFWWYLESE